MKLVFTCTFWTFVDSEKAESYSWMEVPWRWWATLLWYDMLTISNMFLSQGNIIKDEFSNSTYCSYSSDVATGYGVGGFLFLLSSESLLMGVTKCMCFGRPLAPGSSRAWTIIYFFSSWWETIYFLLFLKCFVICYTLFQYQQVTA